MNAVIFLGRCSLLVFSLLMWLRKHPLIIGGCVLAVYILGRVVVGYMVRFVMGIFLFLTGVSGMMVAFLYVVALCPNPTFTTGGSVSYSKLLMAVFTLRVICPFFFRGLMLSARFGTEVGCIRESFQWLRDPCMYQGLVRLIIFLALLLFLCMVRVVRLCGRQEQCLGGHEGLYDGSGYTGGYRFGPSVKREYA